MKRRSPRYPVILPALVRTTPDGPEARACVGNLSAGGLLLARLSEPMAAEDDDIWVEIPEAAGRGRVGMVGRVAWTSEDRAGVAITAMLPHHRERLSMLLERLAD